MLHLGSGACVERWMADGKLFALYPYSSQLTQCMIRGKLTTEEWLECLRASWIELKIQLGRIVSSASEKCLHPVEICCDKAKWNCHMCIITVFMTDVPWFVYLILLKKEHEGIRFSRRHYWRERHKIATLSRSLWYWGAVTGKIYGVLRRREILKM